MVGRAVGYSIMRLQCIGGNRVTKLQWIDRQQSLHLKSVNLKEADIGEVDI